MKTIRFGALVCLLGLTGTAAVLPACGSDVPQEQASAGTLELALTGVSNTGSLYRLRNGTFTIEGPTTTQFSTESDPDATSAELDLPAGDYLITLAEGWSLEKQVDGVFVPAEGTLESANPAMFSIASAAQTGVLFQFRSEGEVIVIGDGTLSVDIAIDDLVCSSGTVNCGGSCVDTSSDPNNCGSCDNACSVQGGSASCSGGVCGVGSCDPGRADCDTASSNGCETSTTNDVQNCGACGLVCSANGGTPSCNAGACSIMCHPGFSDCHPSPGCETPTGNDPNNCGMCGFVCPVNHGPPLCNAGMCGVANCDFGWANCDGQGQNGCEFPLNTDPSCSAPVFVTELLGDSNSNSTISDVGEKRYRFRIKEFDLSSVTAKEMSVRFALSFGGEVGYSIEASCDDGCQTQVSASGNPATVTLRWTEASPITNDSSRDVFVNVIYAGGASAQPSACAPWSLAATTNVNGGQASCTAK